MRPVIVGTAGHVDHGKTTLIRALTGVDTDRLREEKERQLTIDLGFAPFDLPSGRRVGVIDVPGHEKFMGNMLAGIGGIDLVLLVIDANEGVMPQTREHLEVVMLLNIKKAIVVLTKIDTVDPEWLDLVEEEIREELQVTPYGDAPVVRVSALKGIGVDELKEKIDATIDTLEPKDATAPLRLPVDRSFKIKGFGTVITGTLLTGTVEKDQQVEILPQGLSSRLRNIEVHNEAVDKAYAGQRVALNLAGVDKEEVPRGSIIVQPGFFQPTKRLDVELELLPDFPHTLKHASRVHFHLGTNEILAKVYLLNKKEMFPGEKAFAQLELAEEVVAHYQDLFIIRFYSPVRTMGGGRVLNPNPGFYRHYRDDDIAELELLAGGEDKDLVLQRIQHYGMISLQELKKEAKLAEERLTEIMEELKVADLIFAIGEEYLMSKRRYQQWQDKMVQRLENYHQKYHLRPGISRAELKQVLPEEISGQKYELLLNLLVERGTIRLAQHLVARADFAPVPLDDEQKIIQKLQQFFLETNVETPSPEELSEELKIDLEELQEFLDYLIYQGQLVQINDGFYLDQSVVTDIQEKLVAFLQERGEISLGDARDLLDSSRKYTMPLMEYFDAQNITRRKGNIRVLVHSQEG